MTEQQWLECSSPPWMIDFLSDQASPRKLDLFCCACCRTIWEFIIDKQSRTAVEVLERFADGEATQQELASASQNGWVAIRELEMKLRYNNPENLHFNKETGVKFSNLLAAAIVARSTTPKLVSRAKDVSSGIASFVSKGAWEAEEANQANLLREIFGNPFQPVFLKRRVT